MTTGIRYVDEERMKIQYSTMIFNVKRINSSFGSLASFIKQYDLEGTTNGRLFCLAENPAPAPELYEAFEEIFRPLGLEKGSDYLYFFCHPLSEMKCEHPSCVGTSWLEGEILPEGNFIWYREAPSISDRYPQKELSLFPSSQQRTTSDLSVPSFKILDIQDPDPGFPPELSRKVSFEKFISPEEEGFPVFIATHVGVFPEEVFMEALEGQKVAVLYSSLSAPVCILQIINGKGVEVARISLDESLSSGGIPN